MNSTNQLSNVNELDKSKLQAEIEAIRAELMKIHQIIDAFEATLRTALIDELILEQELTALYRQQKKAKKKKRLEQKKRGKNYQEPTGIILHANRAKTTSSPEDEKALKKLYREAMLYVHPDKFSMDDTKQDLAHEATTHLIQLYQQGDYKALQAYVSHVMSGELMSGKVVENIVLQHSDPLEYLKNELSGLQVELETAKNRYTYKVWSTYADPNSFIDELREYYQDRINKLKRRTRTK